MARQANNLEGARAKGSAARATGVLVDDSDRRKIGVDRIGAPRTNGRQNRRKCGHCGDDESVTRGHRKQSS